MVFPRCFASLTTCKCPPSWVSIKCQNVNYFVIAVERLMHCVTMMMPATAVVVTAGLAWFSRLAPSLGCFALLHCAALCCTVLCSALLCCSLDRLLQCHQLLLQHIFLYFPPTNNILKVSTLRQGPVPAESRRLGASLPEFVVPLSSL